MHKPLTMLVVLLQQALIVLRADLSFPLQCQPFGQTG
jgi:hypothetical protein